MNQASSVVPGALPPPSPGIVQVIAEGRELPLLDVGPYLAGEYGALAELAANVRAIQEGLGFYAIINHGIDQAIVDDAVRETARLFHLPEAELQRHRGGYHLQGYWPPRSTGNPDGEFADEEGKVGSLAGWAFLREREPGDPRAAANVRHRIENKWPPAALVPEFRATLSRYNYALLELGLRLVPVYAAALGLPADAFDAHFKCPEWYMRCNFYRGGKGLEGQVATVAHVDHSFMTLLPMSPVPGLEVRTHHKQWMPVSHVPGAIIVNTGEWLSQLSNGRFRATPHRVMEPGSERITIPLFLDPDDDMRNDPVTEPSAPGFTFPRRSFHEHFVAYLSSHYDAQHPGEPA
jgi:isopenicillin N synthase-like dioxygenase